MEEAIKKYGLNEFSVKMIQNEEIENLCILFAQMKSPERNHLQNAELIKQIHYNYLAFFGFPSSSITRDELLTFINIINDEVKEEDTELLNSTFGESKSHIMHLPDVIKIIRQINRPFEPLVKFRKNCQEYLLGVKTCEVIQFRLDNLEMIESYRINHNNAFPTVNCCTNIFWKYRKNPYKYDFEPTINDNELSLFSIINSYKQDFYGRRRSHPSIKRVISDGESYTNMAFGTYNRKKSTCSNRSSARSVVVSARVIQVSSNMNNNTNGTNTPNTTATTTSSSIPTPYQMNNLSNIYNNNNNLMNNTSGCGGGNGGGGYMMNSSTTPNTRYNNNTSLFNNTSNIIGNTRKSPSQAISFKSPKSPTLSDTIPNNNNNNNISLQPPATLKITTTDHTSCG